MAWEDSATRWSRACLGGGRKDSDDDHGVAFGRGGGPHRTTEKKDDLNARIKTASESKGPPAAVAAVQEEGTFATARGGRRSLDTSVSQVPEAFAGGVRKCRKGRRSSAPGLPQTLSGGEASAPALLSHQEVAAVCRATLGERASGLDEAELVAGAGARRLRRCAAVPHNGVGDKVEALFIHMGLAERLVEAARPARPILTSHPFDEPPLSFGKQRRVRRRSARAAGGCKLRLYCVASSRRLDGVRARRSLERFRRQSSTRPGRKKKTTRWRDTLSD